MKMKLVRPMVTALAAMMLMATAAYAQDDASIIERLNLSETQKGQVKDLREKFKTKTEKLRADIKRLAEEERNIKKSSNVDESALRELLKRRAELEIELSLALTRFNEDLEGILTADQKRILDKIRAEKRNRR